VGEIGLDYTTDEGAQRHIQREVLSQILNWCAEYQDKVLTLHSRKAARDVIKAIGPGYPGRVILHWFTGTIKELEQAIEYGMYFSVNSAMIQSQKGQKLISRMPKQRVFTESDGPFVKLHSRPAGPYDTEYTLEGLADVWQVSSHEARKIVLTNFRALFTNQEITSAL
jgi:TatD DNase family protein